MAALGISVLMDGVWVDLRGRISREDLASEWLTNALKGDGFFDWGSDPLEIPVVRVCRGHQTMDFTRFMLVDIRRNGTRIARCYIDAIRDEFSALCKLSVLPVHLLLKDVPVGTERPIPGATGEDGQTEFVFDTRSLYGNESGYVSAAGLAFYAMQSYTDNRTAGMPSVQFLVPVVPEDPLPWGGEWIAGDLREVDQGGVMTTPGEDLVMGWRSVGAGPALVIVRTEYSTGVGADVYYADTYRQSAGELVLDDTSTLLSGLNPDGTPRTAAQISEALDELGPVMPDDGPLSIVPYLADGGWRITSQLREIVRDAGGHAIPGTIHQMIQPDGWLFVSWLEGPTGAWYTTRYLALNRLEALKAVFRGAKIADVIKALAALTNRVPVWSINDLAQIQLTLLPRTATEYTALDLQVLALETIRRQVDLQPEFPVNEPDLSGTGFALSKAAVAAIEKYYRQTYTGEVLDREAEVLDPANALSLGQRLTLGGVSYGRVFSLGEHFLDGRRKLKASTEVTA